MQRNQYRVLCLLILLSLTVLAVSTTAQESTQEPPQPTEEAVTKYIVQAGDNLYRIALQFGLTTGQLAAANGITNTSVIHVGQELTIPTVESVAIEEPETTPEPMVTPEPEVTPEPAPPEEEAIPLGEISTYIVQAGDTLFRIAVRFETTTDELTTLNGIADPSSIYVGQQLIIPGTHAVETAVVEPTEIAEDVDMTLDDPGFDYGVILFSTDQDVNLLRQHINQLGTNWVKIWVEWRDLEPMQGQIDYAALDNMVDMLVADGKKVLLTVTSAPTWARTGTHESGPPDDLSDFTTFIGVLAEHYAGRVNAYQIWDEPNIRRNWNCPGAATDRMCDTDYMEMLRQAYGVIKATDEDALVITAGLAPTGFNDFTNAIEDQLFLETLYAQGVADISDAIGVHPGGWANPPDAECCEQPDGVLTHYEQGKFYFLDNLNAYREIMMRYGDEETPVWVTKFGWGTSEDTSPPSDMHVYVTYTDLIEQATYIPRAFTLGQELGYIGPMFLDNLNGCQSNLGRPEFCYTSLTSPAGEFRPAYGAVRGIDKSSVADAPQGETP
jgi:LysM repeat protein